MALTERIAVLVELAGQDQVAAGFRQMGDQAQTTGQKIKTGLKVAGVAAGGLLAAGLAASFGAALDLGQANSKLTAQLGLSAKESARIGSVAGKVYANNWGDSAADVSTALRAVTLNISGMSKASSADLQKVTEKVFAIATAMDQDLGAVTIAVGQLMKTGLAKNADEALDIVTAGFQQGNDKAGDFLDTLNEYGTQFRKLGIDGATATGLISQGLKAGARDADIVADAFKEFAIRAVDGSELTANAFADIGLNAGEMTKQIGAGGQSASGALDLILDRLRAIPDPVQRSAVAVALFGTQAEDLGEALFALDPSTATDGLGDLAGAAERAQAALGGDLKTTIQGLLRALQTGFVDFLESNIIPTLETLGSTVGAVLVPALTVAAKVASVLATAFNAIPTPVLLAAGAVVAMVTAVNLLGRSAATGAIAALASQIGAASAGATTFAGRLRGIGSAAAAGVSTAVGGFGLLGGAIGLAVVGLGIYGIVQGSAARKTGEHKARVAELTAALKESNGALDANVRTTVAKQLSDQGALKTARELGLSIDDVTDAALNGGGALAGLNAQLDKIIAAGTKKTNIGKGGVATEFSDSAEAAKNLKEQLNGTNQELGQSTEKTQDLTAAAGPAAQATEKLAVEQKKAAQTAEEHAKAIDDLKASLDELNGIHVSAIEAQLNFQDAIDGAAQSLKDNGKTLDENTDKGRANYKSLLTIADATKQVTEAAIDQGASVQSITSDWNKGRAELIKAAEDMGYTHDQAVALADSILKIPTEVSTSTDLPNYPTTTAELVDIFKKVKEIPPKKDVTVNSLSDAAKEKLTKLGIQVKTLPDGKVTITAPTDKAAASLNGFLATARAQKIKIPITSYVQSGSGAGIYVNGKKVGMAAGGIVRGPGSGTSDSIPAPWLSDGEFVMPAEVTRRYLPVLEAMRKKKLGKGMAAGGVYNPEGPFISAEWVPGTIQAALDRQLSMLRITAPQTPGVGAFVGAAYSGGGSLGQWLHRAMAITGVPESWFQPLVSLVMHESGGNPLAQNNWDRNAIAGIPSRGLLQTIQPTFDAYALPGLGNVWDPVANAVAAIRYMIARYGSIFNIASYTPNGFVGGYEKGGMVEETGLALVHKGERVQTEAQQKASTIDYDRLAAAMTRALLAAGVTVQLDGRSLGRLIGANATRLAR